MGERKVGDEEVIRIRKNVLSYEAILRTEDHSSLCSYGRRLFHKNIRKCSSV